MSSSWFGPGPSAPADGTRAPLRMPQPVTDMDWMRYRVGNALQAHDAQQAEYAREVEAEERARTMAAFGRAGQDVLTSGLADFGRGWFGNPGNLDMASYTPEQQRVLRRYGVKAERDLSKELADEHPWASLAGGLTGGTVLTMIPGLRSIWGLGSLPGMSAAYGLGHNVEDFAPDPGAAAYNSGLDAAGFGMFGAALHGAARGIGKAVQGGRRWFGDRVTDALVRQGNEVFRDPATGRVVGYRPAGGR